MSKKRRSPIRENMASSSMSPNCWIVKISVLARIPSPEFAIPIPVEQNGGMGKKAKKRTKKKSANKSAADSSNPQVSSYYTTGFEDQQTEIPQEFGNALQGIESELNMPVWLMLQTDGRSGFGQLDSRIFREFRRSKNAQLTRGKKIALVLDSPGGDAHAAFLIARLLQQHCGGFTAVVPTYAKSAATLLCLGADEIYMGEDAQLGPLDAQILDAETEDRRSVLEYVQSLERLEAFSMRSIDDMTQLLLSRTGKKISTILPLVMELVPNLVRPLFENVDVVQYTQMARILKVAEDYAVRLLRMKYDSHIANRIARALVSNYSDHAVAIDQEEARQIGLKIRQPSEKLHHSLETAAKYDVIPGWGKIKATP